MATLNTHIARAGWLCRRLPASLAARLILSRLARALLRPGTQESYSQLGEDIILWGLLRHGPPGFYVDVGCNHPLRDSNTFRLYLEGWHGITIDASAPLIALHRRLRPGDVPVCAVVSDREEEVAFAELPESRRSRMVTADWGPAAEDRARIRRVTSRTLNAILAEHDCPHRFGLLNLDLEGHEAQALGGLSLERFRPDVVAVEIHGLDLSKPQASPSARHLLDAGYALIGCLPPTAIFRDSV